MRKIVSLVIACVLLGSSVRGQVPPVPQPFIPQSAPIVIYPPNAGSFIGSAIVQRGRVVAQTAAATVIATFTAPAGDTTYWVSGNINLAGACTCSFNMLVNYTDENNATTGRPMLFIVQGGSIPGNPVVTSGPNSYQGIDMQIRVKGGTSVSITTAGATFTSVTYNAEAVVRQCLVCP